MSYMPWCRICICAVGDSVYYICCASFLLLTIFVFGGDLTRIILTS
uniref:Uncharacterized protein n=1 Tax=Rhizophora mucronata TaxID=61149 RepID=A0A2P2NN67_RHIMU